MSDMIIHEPLASRLREAAVKGNTTPEALVAEFLANWERQSRLEEFERMVRPFGEEVERQGISEEELIARVEQARQQLHEEGYDPQPE